jgi:hypothetical protein
VLSELWDALRSRSFDRKFGTGFTVQVSFALLIQHHQCSNPSKEIRSHFVWEQTDIGGKSDALN